jgi:hypothetical protein
LQDRPTASELLIALEHFLDEQVVPQTTGAVRFHGRIAANVVRTLRRQLDLDAEHLEREWMGLDALLGPQARPAGDKALRAALVARNEQLCERIRAGDADSGSFRQAATDHVRRTVRDKLLVTNPAWLEADNRVN